MERCLLLQLPDQREIFTHEHYHDTLLEFAKSFGINIIVIEAESPDLVGTEDIVKIFCDQSFKPKNCNYKVLQKPNDVRTYIETALGNGQIIKIKELHRCFHRHSIAVSTLYRHLDFVRKKLRAENKEVVKVMVGCYRLIQQ